MQFSKRLRVAFSPPVSLPPVPLPPVRHAVPLSPRTRPPLPIHMSGVNGGMEYEIDLASLSPPLARRVRYIQSGPDSPTELIAAARDLAAAAPATPAMLPVLVDVLGFNNPVAADVAVGALAAAGSAAVPSLLVGVGAFNYAVNGYALRALGRVGDPAVLSVVAACARQGPIPGVRRAACAALAGLRFERGEEAAEGFECLLALADGEADWGVRYAAVVGIERFWARGLLEGKTRRKGVEVLRGIVDGRHNVLGDAKGEDGEVKSVESDPTVVARAIVALEALGEEAELVEKVIV